MEFLFFLFVVFLIFGFVPGLIGFAIGRATAKRRTTPSSPELAKAWDEGFAAGQQSREPSPSPAPQTPVQPPAQPAPPQQLPATPQPPRPVPPRQAPPQQPVLPAGPRQPAPVRQPLQQARTPEPVQPRVLTPEEKQRRNDRNINIALYSATLLIVAAAALFIGASFPTAVIITVLSIITIAFYASGLVLYTASPRLKPAARAFIGTGVALLPLVGVTVWLNTPLTGTQTWFGTSIIGLAAVFVATLRLRSTFGVYLMIPLIISSVSTGAYLVQAGYLGTLMILIALAIMVSWILRALRPTQPPAEQRSLKDIFLQALEQMNFVLVPGTIVVSWLSLPVLTDTGYFWLHALATVYFIQAVFFSQGVLRGVYVVSSYGVTFLTVMFGCRALELSAEHTYFALGAYTLLAAVSLYLMIYLVKDPATGTHRWAAGALVGLGISYVLGAALTSVYENLRPVRWENLNVLWVGFAVLSAAITLHEMRRGRPTGGRAGLTLLYPFTVGLAVVLYDFDSLIAIGTTISMILIFLAQIVGTVRPEDQPADTFDRFLQIQLSIATTVLLLTQLMTAGNVPWDPYYGILTAVLGLWSLAVLLLPTQQRTIGHASQVLWILLLMLVTLIGVVSASDLRAHEGFIVIPIAQAVILAATIAVATVFAATQRRSLQVTGVTVGITALAQVFALMTWSELPTTWYVIAGLTVLAAWLVVLAGLRWLGETTLPRMLLMSTGQALTLVIVPLIVAELEGSYQARLTAMSLTAAIMTLTAFGVTRSYFSRRSLDVHSWVAAGMIVILALTSASSGTDRIGLAVTFASLLAVALRLGLRAHGIWLVTPAAWLILYVFSSRATGTTGWLIEPLYSGTVLSWITLIASILALAAVAIWGPTLFDTQKLPRGHALQLLSIPVVLLVTGFGLAQSVQEPLSTGQSTLYVVLLALFGYLLAFFTGHAICLLITIAAACGTGALTTQFIAHYAPSSTWPIGTVVASGLITAVLLLVLSVIDQPVRTSLRLPARAATQPTSGIIPHVGLRYAAWGILIVLSGLAVLTTLSFTAPLRGLEVWRLLLAVMVLVGASWILSTEISRKTLPVTRGTVSVSTGWTVQSLAMGITTLAGLTLWAMLVSPTHWSQDSYWMILAIALVAGLWALRFQVSTHQPEGTRWRNTFWWIAAGIFSFNSLTLTTGGTGVMQLTGLIGFVIILVLGLLTSLRSLTLWGAIGITASVLWYLRGLTWVWVGALGLAILAGAIWQLRRTSNEKQNQQNQQNQQAPHVPQTPPTPHAPQAPPQAPPAPPAPPRDPNAPR